MQIFCVERETEFSCYGSVLMSYVCMFDVCVYVDVCVCVYHVGCVEKDLDACGGKLLIKFACIFLCVYVCMCICIAMILCIDLSKNIFSWDYTHKYTYVRTYIHKYA